MDLNFKSKMQFKNRVSFNGDLEDSFAEIFRSRQNSNYVSPNVSNQNGQQKRTELSATFIQKDESMFDGIIIQKDEFCRLHENESASKLNDFCNLLKDNVIQHCPICFKKNTCDQISGFITHLKGCAFKHKISTEQLIKAVQLLEKQTSERVALGLPKIASEKTSMKKNYTKKVGMDSNMQLAMALSVSLRESEYLTRLKETETLIEAGLEQEVVSSCKQLEDFGFKTSKSCDVKPHKTNSRSKDRNTILFSRSQAERERIITEKVAIILIDSEEQNSDSILSANFCHFQLKSKFLRTIRDENCEVWKKSFQSNEEASDKCYYLENLSNFISPCTINVAAKLKHISQIPGRFSSEESHFSRSLQELIDFFRPTTNEALPKSTTKIISSHPPVVRKPKISTLSANYKSLVNKKLMSDITIYAKTERSIYAHKLVFHARCGAILDDTIKETENGKISEIIMWMEFCYESVIAFLEYIYADASDSLNKLDESQLFDLRELCVRYHVNDLKARIDELSLKDEPFVSNAASVEENFDNCLSRSHNSTCTSSDREDEITDGTPSPNPIDGEENLKFLLMALATQNNQPSPEMFGDSDTAFAEENDFSLSIQDSSPNGTCSHGDTPINSVDSTAIEKCESSLAKLSQKLNHDIVGEEKATTSRWTCDTDVICLSDDDDCASIPEDLDQIKLNGMKSEKRKSPSPLLMSPVKKPLNELKLEKRKSPSPLLMSPAKKPIWLNNSLAKQSPLEGKVRKKRRMKKTDLSQYTLSDSPEFSDSDESLYKIRTNICEPSPGCSFSADYSLSSTKPSSKNEASPRTNKLISPDSSFELDDFRNLEPESRNFSNPSYPVVGECCNTPTSKSEALANSVNSRAEVEAPPYISPIWDGFEGCNDDYFVMNFSPSPVAPVSKFSTPVKNLLTKSLVSPISSRTFRGNSCNSVELHGNKDCASSRTPDVPTFESFSIDESVLSKLEKKSCESKPSIQSQIATPSSVRKLKARSKSDTFLTPSPRGNGCVTPVADYSGMKTVELKRELDKYGIKPGLGRNRAKQLLRHIYDQLHPLDGKSTPKQQQEEKQKPKKKSRRKNCAGSDHADGKLAAILTDSDESSNSFASGIEELEASFVDDVQNLDTIEESKSQNVSIDTAFKNLLREDKELHTQVLLYEPIWLDQVKVKLKEKNIKCSSSSLMNYLDEKCITFRTLNQRRVRTRRKKIKVAVETQST